MKAVLATIDKVHVLLIGLSFCDNAMLYYTVKKLNGRISYCVVVVTMGNSDTVGIGRIVIYIM